MTSMTPQQRVNDAMARVILKTAAWLVLCGWTRGVMARDKDGHETSADSPDATCFCSLGAIERVTDAFGMTRRVRDRAIKLLAVEITRTGTETTHGRELRSTVYGWNDRKTMTSHKVARCMRRAAAA